MDTMQLPSDEERTMLRDSIRGILGQHWPADQALSYAEDGERLRGIWRILCEQGYAALGVDGAGGGLREAMVVMAELGRAACPAPMLDAAIINLFLSQRAEVADLRASLAEGTAFACVSFAGADPDQAVGCITGVNGRFSGKVGFVEAASCATHVAFIEGDGATMAIVPLSADVTITATRAMGADGQYVVELRDAPGLTVPLGRDCIGDML